MVAAAAFCFATESFWMRWASLSARAVEQDLALGQERSTGKWGDQAEERAGVTEQGVQDLSGKHQVAQQVRSGIAEDGPGVCAMRKSRIVVVALDL